MCGSGKGAAWKPACAACAPESDSQKAHSDIDRAHTGMKHSSEASIKDQAHKLVKYGCEQSEAHQSEHQAAPRTLIPSFPLLAALKQHSVLALPAAAFFTLCTSSPPASRNRRHRRRREEKSSMDYRVSATTKVSCYVSPSEIVVES